MLKLKKNLHNPKKCINFALANKGITPTIKINKDMETKQKCYVVEVAKYDCNVEVSKAEKEARFERAMNGVDSYEDFRIQGIYKTIEEAEERFLSLRDAQVKAWEEEGALKDCTLPYNLFKEKKDNLYSPIPISDYLTEEDLDDS